MFGRKPAAEPEVAADPAATPTGRHASPTPEASVDTGKGRPTPKRREAERGRRRAITAPRNRKEAARLGRERARDERGRRMQGLRDGDERHLPARDQGPVRRYVRDLVDSRRSVAEFFLPLALVILLLSWFGSAQLKLFGSSLWLALVVLIVLDSGVLVWRLRRGLAQHWPDESHRGATSYALMRSMQIRRFRLPPPRLKTRGRPR